MVGQSEGDADEEAPDASVGQSDGVLAWDGAADDWLADGLSDGLDDTEVDGDAEVDGVDEDGVLDGEPLAGGFDDPGGVPGRVVLVADGVGVGVGLEVPLGLGVGLELPLGLGVGLAEPLGLGVGLEPPPLDAGGTLKFGPWVGPLTEP